jgi:hypothetical protein
MCGCFITRSIRPLVWCANPRALSNPPLHQRTDNIRPTCSVALFSMNRLTSAGPWRVQANFSEEVFNFNPQVVLCYRPVQRLPVCLGLSCALTAGWWWRCLCSGGADERGVRCGQSHVDRCRRSTALLRVRHHVARGHQPSDKQHRLPTAGWRGCRSRRQSQLRIPQLCHFRYTRATVLGCHPQMLF